MRLRDGGRSVRAVRYEDFFHIGIIVPDIQRDLDEIARRFGVTFPNPPGHTEVLVRAGGSETAAIVRGAYSAEGPPWLEVIQAVPGTPWEAGAGSRIHHLGAFVDDLDDEVARLTAAGAEVEAMLDVTTGRILTAAYVNGALGVRQELLPASLREGMLQNLGGNGPA